MTSPVTAHPAYDPALPTRQAAQYLGIHPKTLHDLTRRGRIAVVRTPGGRLSYRLSELNRYLESLTQRPRQAKTEPDIDWGR